MADHFVRRLRERVKRLPVFGPRLHHLYLVLFRREGEVCLIRAGRLQGMKLRRFNRTFRPKYLDGTYEKHLQDALARELKPGDVFWDVGANGGFFTLLAARLVGGSGRVVAFEPHPITCQQLRAQVAVNHFFNVTIIEKAVADRAGRMSFVDDDRAVMARLGQVQSEHQSARLIEVETTTLDDELYREGVGPNVVKIDIEGAELMALTAGERLLQEHRPTLFMEIHGTDLARKVRALLERYDYALCDSDGRPLPGDESVRLICARPNRAGERASRVENAESRVS